MAGPPTQRHACAWLSALVLCLASCEGRSLLPSGDGIDFGDGDGEPGDGDGEPGDGDGEPGDGDGEPIVDCVPTITGDLLITDATPPESLECIERVLGDLTIGPTTQLINLESLASLRAVDGGLHIVGNLALITLAGLESLERVEWLHIRRNRNLSGLRGLGGLGSVERITVRNNDGLTSLVGLPEGLAPSKLEIADNQLLASLDGLPSFATSDLQIEIDANPSLIDLGGLSKCCAEQALSITLADNDKLSKLDGLASFAQLDTLRLHDNPALTSLAGLDSLVELRRLEIGYDRCAPDYATALTSLLGAPNLSVLEELKIEWAKNLTSLAGLEGISELALLQIRNNAALPWDAVLELAGQTGAEVFEACGGVGGPACPPDPCPMF